MEEAQTFNLLSCSRWLRCTFYFFISPCEMKICVESNNNHGDDVDIVIGFYNFFSHFRITSSNENFNWKKMFVCVPFSPSLQKKRKMVAMKLHFFVLLLIPNFIRLKFQNSNTPLIKVMIIYFSLFSGVGAGRQFFSLFLITWTNKHVLITLLKIT